MHIPDNFIDAKTALATAGLSAVGVGVALARVKRELPPRKIPLLGLSAAFLFAAQMVNFPVIGGTSGHLVGGALVAALLGPSAAVVVLTTVIIVQCFLFSDGGVTALGANIFNMAIIQSVSGWIIFRLVARFLRGLRGQVTALAFASWCATVIASISCAGQLSWSKTVSWASVFPAMTGIHIFIGIGEGLISALVFLAIQRTRPDFLATAQSSTNSSRRLDFLFYGALVVLGIAIFIAPFACPWPDGLDHVADKLGFGKHAIPPVFRAPLPDYQVPGVRWAVGGTAIAGVIGSLIVFVIAFLLGWLLVPGRAHPPAKSSEPPTC